MTTAITVAGRTGGEVKQFVSFTVDQEEFAVEVGAVKEIMRLPEITRMPNAPACMAGIISLRGSVIPIISLRQRFGLPQAEVDSRTRIMVMNIGSSVVGFQVDAVSEVIRVDGAEIKPPPPLVAGSERQCVGVIESRERMLIMLDPKRMLPEGELDPALLGEAA